MTQAFYPFSNSPILTTQQWSKMAEHWLGTGIIKDVLNELQVYAISSGLQINVKTGAASIKGHYYESDEEAFLPIAGADPTNPRIDRVILRLDWTNNYIALAILQGTPSVSPVAPALTQNTSRWEIALAQVRVNVSASSITAVDVSDERHFVKNANSYQPGWIQAALQNGYYNVAQFDGAGTDYLTSYFKDTVGNVRIVGVVARDVPFASGSVIFTLPEGYRPSKNFHFKVGCRLSGGVWSEQGQVYVSSSGLVTLDFTPSDATMFWLDGLTFKAER